MMFWSNALGKLEDLTQDTVTVMKEFGHKVANRHLKNKACEQSFSMRNEKPVSSAQMKRDVSK